MCLSSSAFCLAEGMEVPVLARRSVIEMKSMQIQSPVLQPDLSVSKLLF